jgi:hypothetical protein
LRNGYKTGRIVAKRIIEAPQKGVIDPASLCAYALSAVNSERVG